MMTKRTDALVLRVGVGSASELRGPLAWGALAGVCGGAVVAAVFVLAMAGQPEGADPGRERTRAGAGERERVQSVRTAEAAGGRDTAGRRRGDASAARTGVATGPGTRTGSGVDLPADSDSGSPAESGSAVSAGAVPGSAEPTTRGPGALAQASGDGGGIRGGRGAGTPGAPTPESSEDAEEQPVAAAGTDADLLLLQQLGVDLSHPEAEMRRLAAEYRAGLLASADPSAPVDAARQSLLDRGMAALLRVKPQTTATVNELLQYEFARAPSRYFANLLRGGQRATVEPALAAMAGADPDPSRRASAVLAFGPAPGEGGWPTVLSALRDPAVEVREMSAGVIASSARLAPASAARADVREALRGALVAETDPAVRLTVLRVFVGPSGAVSATDRAFLASLGRIDAEPYFQAEWTRAVAAGN